MKTILIPIDVEEAVLSDNNLFRTFISLIVGHQPSDYNQRSEKVNLRKIEQGIGLNQDDLVFIVDKGEAAFEVTYDEFIIPEESVIKLKRLLGDLVMDVKRYLSTVQNFRNDKMFLEDLYNNFKMYGEYECRKRKIEYVKSMLYAYHHIDVENYIETKSIEQANTDNIKNKFDEIKIEKNEIDSNLDNEIEDKKETNIDEKKKKEDDNIKIEENLSENDDNPYQNFYDDNDDNPYKEYDDSLESNNIENNGEANKNTVSNYHNTTEKIEDNKESVTKDYSNETHDLLNEGDSNDDDDFNPYA